MYRLPLWSSVTPFGNDSWACLALAPSPQLGGLAQAFPVPATVAIVPSEETLRTLLSLLSAMYTSPVLSIATAVGTYSCALVAAPPSPQAAALLHALPSPATRVIVPLGETPRTAWSPLSAM